MYCPKPEHLSAIPTLGIVPKLRVQDEGLKHCAPATGPHLRFACAAVGDVGGDGVAEEAGVLCYNPYLASVPLCVHLCHGYPINQNLSIEAFEVLALHQHCFRQINHGTPKSTQNTPANMQKRIIMSHPRTDQDIGRSGYQTSKHRWLLQ